MVHNPSIAPVTAEYMYAWFSLNAVGEMPVIDITHPQRNKYMYVLGGENKNTDDWKLSESPTQTHITCTHIVMLHVSTEL